MSWIARRTNESTIEDIYSKNPLEAFTKKQQLSHFGHIMRRENSLETSVMFGMGGGTGKETETTSTLARGHQHSPNYVIDRNAW